MARILIVEDDDPLRRIITLTLVRRGHAVAEADSVSTAEEACEASVFPFDVLLLDVNLPDGTGWELLRRRRAALGAAPDDASSTPALPPVILLTAVPPARSRVATFCPAAVLLKPFPMEALLRLIERVLTPRGMASEPQESPEDSSISAASSSASARPDAYEPDPALGGD
jgi:DNA-binding response OmpR family regulator